MLLAAAVPCLIQSLPVQSSVQDHSLANHGVPWPVARKLARGRSIGATQWPPQWPRGMKTRRHLEQLKDTSRQLQNAPGRECDPTKVLSDGSGADLGILTCSEGQYCVESMESSLGGYCTDILVPMEGRKLQGNDSSSSVAFDYLYYLFCSDEIPGVECNCTNADREASTLDIQCKMELCPYYFQSQCSVNVTACYVDEWSHSLKSPYENHLTECYTFSEPYYQKICYSYTFTNATFVDDYFAFKVPECSLEFNGTTCNSCKVVQYDEYITTSDFFVMEFDCTNTEGNQSGIIDNENDVNDFNLIVQFLKAYGCAESGTTPPPADGNNPTDPPATDPPSTAQPTIVGLSTLGVSLAVMSTMAFAY